MISGIELLLSAKTDDMTDAVSIDKEVAAANEELEELALLAFVTARDMRRSTTVMLSDDAIVEFPEGFRKQFGCPALTLESKTAAWQTAVPKWLSAREHAAAH